MTIRTISKLLSPLSANLICELCFFSTTISTRQSVLTFKMDKDDEEEGDDGDDDSKDLCGDDRGEGRDGKGY